MKRKNELLGIEIDQYKKGEILEKIKKYTLGKGSFCHIISLNPENLVIASRNHLFKKVIRTGQIKIIDGAGIVLAGQILNIDIPPRLQGVELMEKMVKVASDQRMKVLLIGGNGNLAEKLEDCYRAKYPELEIMGIKGINNIKRVKKSEEDNIFSIVTDYKPRLIFVSFGSPYQELWIYRNQDRFKGAVCMGVGGAFSFLSGSISRAPKWMRKLGLEWFFRLLTQPWRIRRQLRLIKFGFLVFKQKLALL